MPLPLLPRQPVLLPAVHPFHANLTAETCASAQAARPAAMEDARKTRLHRAKKHSTGHQETAATASATAAHQPITNMRGLPPGPPSTLDAEPALLFSAPRLNHALLQVGAPADPAADVV